MAHGVGVTANAIWVALCAVIAVACLVAALSTGRYALLVGFAFFGGGDIFLLRHIRSDL